MTILALAAAFLASGGFSSHSAEPARDFDRATALRTVGGGGDVVVFNAKCITGAASINEYMKATGAVPIMTAWLNKETGQDVLMMGTPDKKLVLVVGLGGNGENACFIGELSEPSFLSVGEPTPPIANGTKD